MLTRRRTVTTDGFIALPFDYLETYQLQLPANATQTPDPLTYIGPDEAARYKAQNTGGNTRYYTIIDGAYELIPAPSSSGAELTITYYAKIPALSSTTATNWLLTKSPDLYLYSALLEAVPYLKDEQRLQLWAAARQQVMDAMNEESERASRSTTQLVARRRSF